eukprot:TRINITY_DN114_c0_g1_i1.p2 TRINITY_DN114_c0_g1~~TRINITY_DN114_c0_g1_i1.p2  ORF type:complete len:160 (-),score=22.96 TRINITY_DN114_c0_g1_i1:846-1325(-)
MKLQLCWTLSGAWTPWTIFVTTNHYKGEHRTWKFLLDEVEHTTLHPRYEHAGIPYLATVKKYDGYDYGWVDLKLANKGFIYFSHNKHPAVYRHTCEGWVTLPPAAWDKFPKTRARFKHYEPVAVYYNYDHHYVDMELSHDEGRRLLITFKDGHPLESTR